ncbi:MAG: hypothetical protein HKN13_13430, partial [Rhodothermales bacterium]|nr:hypothetical protein [Rhodothermales bacterium]
EAYLAERPEKYRDATRELFHFVNKRAGGLEPREVGKWGHIGWGDDGNNWYLVGICARATGALLYVPAPILDPYDDLLRSHRTGLTCVKLSRIGTIDENVLDDIVSKAFKPASEQRQGVGKDYAERAASKEHLESFDEYLAGKPEKVHGTARKLYDMIKGKIGEEAYAYDSHVLGFGKRDDGWFKICMAARAGGVMLYTSGEILDDHSDLIKKSWRTGQGCLKLSKWEQLPEEVIEDIVDRTLAE